MIRLLGAVLVTFVVISPASSQTPREVLLKAQRSNWIVKAVSESDSTAPGRILTITSDSVRIARTALPLQTLIRIDRRLRTGSGGGSAAFGGALAMGLIGLGFIAALCSGDCSVLQLAGGTAMGATLGGTVGGLIGAAATPGKEEWTPIWARE